MMSSISVENFVFVIKLLINSIDYPQHPVDD